MSDFSINKSINPCTSITSHTCLAQQVNLGKGSLGVGLMKYWSPRSHGRWSRGLLSQWLTPKSQSSYLASTSKVIAKFLCI